MSTRFLISALASLAVGSPIPAQTPPNREPIAWTTKWFYDDAKRNFLEAAALMPAEDYGFAPAQGVRTFGQIVGHMANWQFTNCSAAKGEANPNTVDFETAEGKAAILEGIRSAYAYCDGQLAGCGGRAAAGGGGGAARGVGG